jgi:hypothetical protein
MRRVRGNSQNLCSNCLGNYFIPRYNYAAAKSQRSQTLPVLPQKQGLHAAARLTCTAVLVFAASCDSLAGMYGGQVRVGARMYKVEWEHLRRRVR